jgi:hypothetical protein
MLPSRPRLDWDCDVDVMIVKRTFSDEAAKTWPTYSPAEIEHQFVEKRSLPLT